MVEFRKRKQNDGIKLVEKPKKQEVKVNTQKIQEDVKERSKEQCLFQRFLNFFKKDKHYSENIHNSWLIFSNLAQKLGLFQNSHTSLMSRKMACFFALFFGASRLFRGFKTVVSGKKRKKISLSWRKDGTFYPFATGKRTERRHLSTR